MPEWKHVINSRTPSSLLPQHVSNPTSPMLTCLQPRPAAGRSEDGDLSESSAAFVSALAQERGLHAMALIVAEVEQTQQWPAAAEVCRLYAVE